MAKANPSGGKEDGSQTGPYQQGDRDPADTGSDDPTRDASASSLDLKQRDLLKLQIEEKSLVGEIARLRAFQTEQAAFAAQVTAAAALDNDVDELKVFVATEKKALPTGTEATINAVVVAVDKKIEDAQKSHTAAEEALENATAAVEKSIKEVAKADERYTAEKQAGAERKRVLGELKNLRKAVQDAHTRSDFEAAAFWLIQLDKRLGAIPAPDAGKLKTAWNELEQYRNELDGLKGAVEIAKAEEARTKTILGELKKTREADVLVGLHPPAATKTRGSAA